MKLINLNKNYLIDSIFILLIFLFDRFSKIYVIYLDNKFLESKIFSSKFLNIQLIWNEGVAFGLLSFEKQSLYNILTLIILIIILIIFFMIIKSIGFKRYALLMILSGALGNLYDRIFYNAVPDFIDFHIGNFHWFVFNVADIFISLGIFLMIVYEFIDMNEKNNS
tara:strand:+ start:261 stop:758 length:498 start_codon:yes stop_codon:yes gene_type:complete